MAGDGWVGVGGCSHVRYIGKQYMHMHGLRVQSGGGGSTRWGCSTVPLTWHLMGDNGSGWAWVTVNSRLIAIRHHSS